MMSVGQDSVFVFDPGPVARAAGPWTRLRRSFLTPQAAVAGSGQFNPGLRVQVPGPLTRLRRTSSGLAIDPGELLPAEWTGAALRAAPVAATVVGAVAVSNLLDKPRTVPRARAIPPAAEAEPAPVRTAEAPAPEPALGRVDARLVGAEAVLPDAAPEVLKQAVAAANRIEGHPYSYGGGHGSFDSAGYDCSGAVSYMLHGAGLLDSPLASGALAGWGEPGPGKAITVYANSGHTFAVVAGLRWDTSGTGGSGPGWHGDMRSTAGYVARHPAGL